jgi:hypothetical protein
MQIVMNEHKTILSQVESSLADKSLLKLEEWIIEDLYSKEIITPKLYIKFKEEIEEEIYCDLRKSYDV